MLTVVQWRAPKDLNTLMQRFGHAGRDFLLQAVAILLAEPKWFLEDHEKWLAWKRKEVRRGERKHQGQGLSRAHYVGIAGHDDDGGLKVTAPQRSTTSSLKERELRS